MNGLSISEVSKIVRNSKRPIVLTFDCCASKAVAEIFTTPKVSEASEQVAKKSRLSEHKRGIEVDAVDDKPVSEEKSHADSEETEKLGSVSSNEAKKPQSDNESLHASQAVGSSGIRIAPKKHENAAATPAEVPTSIADDTDNRCCVAHPAESMDRIVQNCHSSLSESGCDETSKAEAKSSSCSTSSKSVQGHWIKDPKKGYGEEQRESIGHTSEHRNKRTTPISESGIGDQVQRSTPKQKEHMGANIVAVGTMDRAEQPSVTTAAKVACKPLPSIEELNRHRLDNGTGNVEPANAVNICQAHASQVNSMMQTSTTNPKPTLSVQSAHHGGSINPASNTSKYGAVMNPIPIQKNSAVSSGHITVRGHHLSMQDSTYQSRVAEQPTAFVKNNVSIMPMTVAHQRTMTTSNHTQGTPDERAILANESQQRDVPSGHQNVSLPVQKDHVHPVTSQLSTQRLNSTQQSSSTRPHGSQQHGMISGQHHIPVPVHRDHAHPVSTQLSAQRTNSTQQSLGTRSHYNSIEVSQEFLSGFSGKSPAIPFALQNTVMRPGQTQQVDARPTGIGLKPTHWQQVEIATRTSQDKATGNVLPAFKPRHHITDARLQVLARGNNSHSSAECREKHNSIRVKLPQSDLSTTSQETSVVRHHEPAGDGRTVSPHQSRTASLNKTIILEPIPAWNHYDYTAVSIRMSRLYVKLATFQEQVILTAFLKGANNECGEIEQSGQVLLGDVLVAINGNSLKSVTSPHQIAKLVTGLPRPFQVYFRRAMWEELQH